jgi:hypothetical protein
VKSTGTMLEFQMTTEHEDACRTNLVQKFPLLDHTGAIQAIGGIVTDITERTPLRRRYAVRRSDSVVSSKARQTPSFRSTPRAC